MFTHTDDTPSFAHSSQNEAPAPQRRRPRFTTRAIVALALAGTTIGGGVVGASMTAAALLPAPAAAATLAQAAPASVAGTVYQKVGPSIVEILVSGPTNRRGQAQSGSGSGIVVDSSGYVLTNAHVVADAASVQVQFSSGETRTAKVVGTDT